MEARRAAAAEKKAAAQRATEAQILEDAGRLVAAWNERQAKRMPMLFSPTIGCALKARHWFLWVRCPACHTTQSIDLRTVDRHPFAALTSLITALSCRSCRPYAPFAELVCLSDKSRRRTTRRAHAPGVGRMIDGCAIRPQRSGIQPATSWPTTGMTPGHFSITTWATKISCTRFTIPTWRPIGSRIFGRIDNWAV